MKKSSAPPPPKKLRRADPGGILPELPLYEIPATEEQRKKLHLRWRLLDRQSDSNHPWLRMSRAEWQIETEQLVQKAIAGNDNALFDLIARDPRYLMFPAVIEKIFLWKIDVIGGNQNTPRHTDEKINWSAKLAIHADDALDSIASAVKRTTGKGIHRQIKLRALLDRYESDLARISEVVRQLAAAKSLGLLSDSKRQEIARNTALDEEHVKSLEKNPKAQKVLALKILAKAYGLSDVHLRRRIREAKALPFEP